VTAEGSIEEAALVPVDRAFSSNVRVVHSGAKEINSDVVITESGESIHYEHLVLALGSSWNGALSLPNSRVSAIEHLRSFRKQLDAAKHVLVIGGGAVGLGMFQQAYLLTSVIHALWNIQNMLESYVIITLGRE
jgi:NADPH-dependent 2,4-dienoyl-CoA reductase/sulfur reductase-like enzyme